MALAGKDIAVASPKGGSAVEVVDAGEEAAVAVAAGNNLGTQQILRLKSCGESSL